VTKFREWDSVKVSIQ